MKNKLMIAPAGAGKTTYLINEALKQTEDVLILTYTKTNLAAMKAKIKRRDTGTYPHSGMG